MFYARAHAVFLQTAYICFRKNPRQIRIFGKIFEISSAKRRSFYVYPRRKQNIHALFGTFVGYGCRIGKNRLFAPRIRKRGDTGHGYTFFRVFSVAFSQAVRPVRHENRIKLSVCVISLPKVLSRQKTEFFFKSQMVNIVIHSSNLYWFE